MSYGDGFYYFPPYGRYYPSPYYGYPIPGYYPSYYSELNTVTTIKVPNVEEEKMEETVIENTKVRVTIEVGNHRYSYESIMFEKGTSPALKAVVRQVADTVSTMEYPEFDPLEDF